MDTVPSMQEYMQKSGLYTYRNLRPRIVDQYFDFQCISSCIVLFLSPYMSVTTWTVVLSTSLLIGSASFVVVVRRTNTSDDVVSPVERLDPKESNNNISETNKV
ncbi:hypothetical protein OESDEN_11062 [Oesophagostomum dentatum]|uniref:Uncharacterized protein n=1 Tax=Oesophagostomum dentatum TaxID=61180 RepID=A0A0B1SW14_OESDE|nr:hypothetical protein OESDEN_11062 [Oesophagostomum dentatum]